MSILIMIFTRSQRHGERRGDIYLVAKGLVMSWEGVTMGGVDDDDTHLSQRLGDVVGGDDGIQLEPKARS